MNDRSFRERDDYDSVQQVPSRYPRRLQSVQHYEPRSSGFVDAAERLIGGAIREYRRVMFRARVEGAFLMALFLLLIYLIVRSLSAA